jgi:exodeoxyribonuclease VII small subunit
MTDERSFEELQRTLEAIVQRLERGDVAVDEVIALWQEGDTLYRECARRLEAVELRIEELGIEAPRDDTGPATR